MIVDAPYPGWTVISRRLAELLPDASGSISRCRLAFTDRFSLFPGDDINSLFSLSRYFPGTHLGAKPVVYAGPSSVKDTMNEITLWCEKEDRFVYLDFSLSRISGIPAEEALSWFDAAHAEIHILFDEIVSDEMISRLA